VGAGVLALALTMVGGCGDDPSDSGRSAEASVHQPAGAGQLGRIHVVLQPQPDVLEPEPQLQIHGRFIEYRGVSEALVRARANLPVPVWDQLVLGQCVASQALLPSEGAHSGGSNQRRELLMIDGGDLRVTLGEREFVAPLALVPDILPWLSGVEYGHVDDRIPRLAVEPDGTSPMTVSLDGSPDGMLEGFVINVAVPAQLSVERADLSSDSLTIDWHPPGTRVGNSVGESVEFVVLRLQAFTPSEGGGDEPVGEEITCVVADSGRADLAVAPLVSAGLGEAAELLRVSISRFDVTQVRAGSFGVIDVFVELRTQRTLLSPPRPA
jgi:hypothetical protein